MNQHATVSVGVASASATNGHGAESPVRATGLALQRYFTRAGVSPYDEVTWEKRHALITGEDGAVVFEQRDVDFPQFWSQMATNVVASKYFRGPLGTPQREYSVRQLIERVVHSLALWGWRGGYFATEEDAAIFADELTHLLLYQKAAFNSPVWFNAGVEERPQCSACFINSVSDTMESILTLAKTEGMLFKWGSGTGTNLSTIRSSRERLAGGGTASGPVSFMKGYDAFAGVIKCLTPDTYVYTANGLQQIGEVVDTEKPAGFYTDTSLVLATKDGPAPISQVYVSPESDVYKVTLRHTRLELKGTVEHPVLTLDEHLNLVWKKLGELKPDDLVAVARQIDLWPQEAPSFGDFQPRLVSSRQPVTYPQRLSPALARLLGYLVSEGCMDEERIRFSNANAEVFADFLHCFQEVFGVDVSHKAVPRVHPKTGVTTFQFSVWWRGAIQFLQHVGLTTDGSSRKTVPWSILRSPKAYVIEFLRAYFEGDGHVSHFVYAASASEQLLRQIQLLLLNLGIVGALRTQRVQGKPYYQLCLRGDQARLFLDRVGFVSQQKRHAAHLPPAQNTNIDVVPHVIPAIRHYAKGKNGYYACHDGETRLLNFGFFNRTSRNISYNKLESTVALAETATLLAEDLGQNLQAILHYRFFWDRVAEKEYVGRHRTYDFTVPETHSFIANGIVNHNSGGKTRRAAKMVILDTTHPDIVEFIRCKAEEEKKAWALIDAGYDGSLDGAAYASVFFQNSNNSVRVLDEFMRAVLDDGEWQTRYVTTGEVCQTYRARELMRMIAEAVHVCGDPGMQFDTTINDWHTCPNSGRISASNPCSEYMFLDDTACNLSSLNLLQFLTDDEEFDVEAYRRAVEILILAQEIIVDNASYPTPAIERNSYAFRTLGLGYANLGALLMARGLPYDSDAGRAYAAAVTALMTGQAYLTSARVAQAKGPFAGYALNRDPMLRVIRKHRDSVQGIEQRLVASDLMQAALDAWDDALAMGMQHGYRNAQVTLLAPTGTVAFMMDCDTTGVEPDIALIKYKKLSGGGMMKIVNNTVPLALQRLGYSKSQMKEIVQHIDEHETIEGAPFLREAHLPVFDCAFRPAGGTRSIHHMGHIRMIAAVQPFLSGAISKTVNLPKEATVEDIEQAYLAGWKLGVKALAVYRDGCKRTQPLNTSASPAASTVPKPVRRRLPDERPAITHKFSIAGHEGYLTVGMFDDGTPGEIFLVMAKEGSTISGLMDAFATSVSLALQYGVPLKALIDKFSHMRFEPAGYTNNREIPLAKSIMDYIFRWLASKFLSQEDRVQVGLVEYADAPQPAGPARAQHMPPGVGTDRLAAEDHFTFRLQEDAPSCAECGALMIRNGSCYKCLNCGATSGCS